MFLLEKKPTQEKVGIEKMILLGITNNGSTG
jgi:hypothetical protein